MNPQGTIPCLDDNGAIIIDSHAICAYLVEKFADSDRLYPKDLVQRALVDARMHFDTNLFSRCRSMLDYIFQGEKGMDDEKIEYVQRLWDQLNRFLKNSPYLCGDEMTIADLCLIGTISSVNEVFPFDSERHAAALEWIDRMSQLPYYEETNGQGANCMFHSFFGILLLEKLEQKSTNCLLTLHFSTQSNSNPGIY